MHAAQLFTQFEHLCHAELLLLHVLEAIKLEVEHVVVYLDVFRTLPLHSVNAVVYVYSVVEQFVRELDALA